jgi:competence protein ComEA
VFDMRAYRNPREAQVRLEQLAVQARAEPPAGDLPDEQEWIDVSRPPPPRPPARGAPWWRRGRPGRLIERWTPAGGTAAVTAVVRRRLPVALVIAIAAGAAVAIAVALSSRGSRELPPNLPAAQASSVPATRPDGGGSIVVSVVGRVTRPGLVTVPDGARVADALQAAGGPLPGVDLAALNIARRLSDGEQISVGVPAPPEVGSGPAHPDKVDLNAASLSELDTLPGVGSVTAQRILDWRTKHGRFTSLDQLREVDGIGPARFTQLKNLVTVR